MAVMNRATFPKDLQDGLNAHFGMQYRTLPQEWRDIFDVENSQRAFEEDVLEYGFGAAAEKAEGGSVTYASGGQGWSARYTNLTVALAFAITEEAIEDNRYQQLGPKFSKALARSMNHTKEIYGANVVNFARTAGYTGGDGQVLLSTAHPLAKGGTFSNCMATPAQISEAGLEELFIKIRKAKDDAGIPIAISPKNLVIPPDQEFVAGRLLQTVLRPGTANNDVNAGKVLRNSFYGQDPCILTRMTEATAWGMTTDVPDGLKHMSRIKMQRGMEGDFETGNLRYKARERYAFGWTDPRGYYGSAADNT